MLTNQIRRSSKLPRKTSLCKSDLSASTRRLALKYEDPIVHPRKITRPTGIENNQIRVGIGREFFDAVGSEFFESRATLCQGRRVGRSASSTTNVAITGQKLTPDAGAACASIRHQYRRCSIGVLAVRDGEAYRRAMRFGHKANACADFRNYRET